MFFSHETPIRGSRVLLTGASSGLGRALAQELAREGANLYLTGRNPQRLKAAAKAAAAFGTRVFSGSLEVTKPASVKKAVAAARKNLGGLDILVHSAGGEFSWGPFFAQDPKIERKQIETNYLGTLSLLRAVLPTLLSQGSGLIVNIASLTGVVPTAGMTSYGASKFALYGFSRALDGELKPRGIRVLTVLPPNADTPMLKGVTLPGYPKAVSPEAVALAVLKGMKGRKARIWVGLSGPLAMIYRIWPDFVEWQLARKFHKG